MLLREILSRIPGAAPPPRRVVRVRGIAYDSRQVGSGDLFVAIRGATTDGNRFVADAVERGAVAIASEEPLELPPPVAAIRTADARLFLAQASTIFFQNPSARLRLVGVTGTNGKTTTTYLLESIYRAAGLESCLIGTIGMKIARQPFPAERTTPEAPDLQLFLRRALGEGCTHGVMEVSSHALELKRVFGTRFVVGVFTNLTPDHLDFHRDMESYYQAKRLLFVPAGENHVEHAAINADDPYGERLIREIACPVLGYGLGPGAEVRLLESTTRTPAGRSGGAGAVTGTDLRVGTPSGELRIASRLVGRTNAYNVLAACTAALALGLDREAIRAGVETLEGIPGRTELVDCGQPFAVVVDYAHTPDALEKILATLGELPHRRILTVFGCGGDRDRTKRPIMGRIAAERSDVVIATSDNPRSERPEAILGEIEAGLRQGKAEWTVSVDRRDAIERAILAARPGDIVLIAGKGHETYQVIGDRKLPFDDRKVARDVLTQLAAIEGGGGARRE